MSCLSTGRTLPWLLAWAEIRSLAILSPLQAGTLLNSPSGRQLVLTARHCLGGAQETGYINFVFNFQRPCGGGSYGSFLDSAQGARTLWSDPAYDILLLEIIEKIPSSYGAYMAGWDAGLDTAPVEAAVVHHPAGDFKKVSVVSSPWNTPVVTSSYFLVQYSMGTTEKGSSGSALFDKQSRKARFLAGNLPGSSRAEP